MSAAAERAIAHVRSLGAPASSPASWVRALVEPRAAAGRCMDDYVEAQVHGGLPLGAGVAAVVADPSFRGTPTGALLATLAPELEWHPGFVLGVPIGADLGVVVGVLALMRLWLPTTSPRSRGAEVFSPAAAMRP